MRTQSSLRSSLGTCNHRGATSNSGADLLGLPAPEPGEFLDELSDDARTI
jgi:hypothetical protein